MIRLPSTLLATALVASAGAAPSVAFADPFSFSTGGPNGAMAMASRPSASGQFEIEAADDFVLADTTSISSASFTGLLVSGLAPASIDSVVVEIYRVFPFDSNVARVPNVPTRVNSPSDVAFDARASGAATLSFSSTVLASTFTAANSVTAGGIHPSPNATTGGNGALTGAEVRFDGSFASALVLPAGHYFFVPQVGVSSGGAFYWLSAARPIVAPGTPFAPDLQAWTRDANLDPDWLRVGTDIVGGANPPTFNASFSLAGEVAPAVPEPSNVALLAAGLVALGVVRARRGYFDGRSTLSK